MFRKTAQQSPQVPNEWKPRRREHGGLIPVRRNEKGQLTFKGQTSDETVIKVVRQHPVFYIRPGLPALGMFILLIFFSSLFIKFSVPGAISLLSDIVLAVGFLVALAYFAWKDLSIWWFNVDIITNKRIVCCQGFLTPTRRFIPMDKIVQISLNQTRLIPSIGDVHVIQAGGQYIMKNVRKPRAIRDALEEALAGRPKPSAKASLPAVTDPELNDLINSLGKTEKMPDALPDVDQRYKHLRPSNKLHGPLRRFGGPLRLRAEIHYSYGEYTVMYIQRSNWLLVPRLGPFVLGILACLVLLFLLPFLLWVWIALIVVQLIVIALTLMNFVDDIFILTNRRIIDVERKFIFFNESHQEAEYKNVQVRVKMTHLLQTLLDIGEVEVETPGNHPNIHISNIDHPFDVLDKINEIKTFKDRADQAKAKNERQEELKKWFTSVAAVLEKKVASPTPTPSPDTDQHAAITVEKPATGQKVPWLQGMDLLTAAAEAANVGMIVVPVGEDDSYTAPGQGQAVVVRQNPLPGTLMVLEPDTNGNRQTTIEVTLSKRA